MIQKRKLFTITLFLVSLHSMLLGTFIFRKAGLTPSPFMIYLTGFVDGCMATALLTTYVMFQRENIPLAVPERGGV